VPERHSMTTLQARQSVAGQSVYPPSVGELLDEGCLFFARSEKQPDDLVALLERLTSELPARFEQRLSLSSVEAIVERTDLIEHAEALTQQRQELLAQLNDIRQNAARDLPGRGAAAWWMVRKHEFEHFFNDFIEHEFDEHRLLCELTSERA